MNNVGHVGNRKICVTCFIMYLSRGLDTFILKLIILPLSGGVGAVERVLELDGVVAVPLLELPVVLHVELDQLRQRRELLAPVQVVEVARVL